MCHKLTLLLALSATGLTFGQVTAPQGSAVVGRVLDVAGKPVPGLGLSLLSQFDGSQKAGYRPMKLMTRTTNDGLFNFDLIPPGKYKVCLDARGAGGVANEFLNPCSWTPDATAVTAIAGSRVQMAISLVRGVTLSVRVEDPGKHLDTHQEKTKDADFDLGFMTAQGLYQAARLRSKKADVQEFEMQLPAGVPHRLIVNSKFFDVQDERGPQFAKADGIDLPVQASARASLAVAPPVVVLRITGVKAKP